MLASRLDQNFRVSQSSKAVPFPHSQSWNVGDTYVQNGQFSDQFSVNAQTLFSECPFLQEKLVQFIMTHGKDVLDGSQLQVFGQFLLQGSVASFSDEDKGVLREALIRISSSAVSDVSKLTYAEQVALKSFSTQLTVKKQDLGAEFSALQTVFQEAQGVTKGEQFFRDQGRLVDPNSAEVERLSRELYAKGVLNSAMTDQQIANAILVYVQQNFEYKTDIPTGSQKDSWQSAAVTVLLKSGDCEDLAILQASLLMNALEKQGHSAADVSHRVSVTAGYMTAQNPADRMAGVGHAVVTFNDSDGVTYALDATGDRPAVRFSEFGMEALFSLNATRFEKYGDIDPSFVTALEMSSLVQSPDSNSLMVQFGEALFAHTSQSLDIPKFKAGGISSHASFTREIDGVDQVIGENGVSGDMRFFTVERKDLGVVALGATDITYYEVKIKPDSFRDYFHDMQLNINRMVMVFNITMAYLQGFDNIIINLFSEEDRKIQDQTRAEYRKQNDRVVGSLNKLYQQINSGVQMIMDQVLSFVRSANMTQFSGLRSRVERFGNENIGAGVFSALANEYTGAFDLARAQAMFAVAEAEASVAAHNAKQMSTYTADLADFVDLLPPDFDRSDKQSGWHTQELQRSVYDVMRTGGVSATKFTKQTLISQLNGAKTEIETLIDEMTSRGNGTLAGGAMDAVFSARYLSSDHPEKGKFLSSETPLFTLSDGGSGGYYGRKVATFVDLNTERETMFKTYLAGFHNYIRTLLMAQQALQESKEQIVEEMVGSKSVVSVKNFTRDALNTEMNKQASMIDAVQSSTVQLVQSVNEMTKARAEAFKASTRVMTKAVKLAANIALAIASVSIATSISAAGILPPIVAMLFDMFHTGLNGVGNALIALVFNSVDMILETQTPEFSKPYLMQDKDASGNNASVFTDDATSGAYHAQRAAQVLVPGWSRKIGDVNTINLIGRGFDAGFYASRLDFAKMVDGRPAFINERGDKVYVKNGFAGAVAESELIDARQRFQTFQLAIKTLLDARAQTASELSGRKAKSDVGTTFDAISESLLMNELSIINGYKTDIQAAFEGLNQTHAKERKLYEAATLLEYSPADIGVGALGFVPFIGGTLIGIGTLLMESVKISRNYAWGDFAGWKANYHSRGLDTDEATMMASFALMNETPLDLNGGASINSAVSIMESSTPGIGGFSEIPVENSIAAKSLIALDMVDARERRLLAETYTNRYSRDGDLGGMRASNSGPLAAMGNDFKEVNYETVFRLQDEYQKIVNIRTILSMIMTQIQEQKTKVIKQMTGRTGSSASTTYLMSMADQYNQLQSTLLEKFVEEYMSRTEAYNASYGAKVQMTIEMIGMAAYSITFIAAPGTGAQESSKKDDVSKLQQKAGKIIGKHGTASMVKTLTTSMARIFVGLAGLGSVKSAPTMKSSFFSPMDTEDDKNRLDEIEKEKDKVQKDTSLSAGERKTKLEGLTREKSELTRKNKLNDFLKEQNINPGGSSVTNGGVNVVGGGVAVVNKAAYEVEKAKFKRQMRSVKLMTEVLMAMADAQANAVSDMTGMDARSYMNFRKLTSDAEKRGAQSFDYLFAANEAKAVSVNRSLDMAKQGVAGVVGFALGKLLEAGFTKLGAKDEKMAEAKGSEAGGVTKDSAKKSTSDQKRETQGSRADYQRGNFMGSLRKQSKTMGAFFAHFISQALVNAILTGMSSSQGMNVNQGGFTEDAGGADNTDDSGMINEVQGAELAAAGGFMPGDVATLENANLGMAMEQANISVRRKIQAEISKTYAFLGRQIKSVVEGVLNEEMRQYGRAAAQEQAGKMIQDMGGLGVKIDNPEALLLKPPKEIKKLLMEAHAKETSETSDKKEVSLFEQKVDNFLNKYGTAIKWSQRMKGVATASLTLADGLEFLGKALVNITGLALVAKVATPIFNTVESISHLVWSTTKMAVTAVGGVALAAAAGAVGSVGLLGRGVNALTGGAIGSGLQTAGKWVKDSRAGKAVSGAWGWLSDSRGGRFFGAIKNGVVGRYVGLAIGGVGKLLSGKAAMGLAKPEMRNKFGEVLRDNAKQIRADFLGVGYTVGLMFAWTADRRSRLEGHMKKNNWFFYNDDQRSGAMGRLRKQRERHETTDGSSGAGFIPIVGLVLNHRARAKRTDQTLDARNKAIAANITTLESVPAPTPDQAALLATLKDIQDFGGELNYKEVLSSFEEATMIPTNVLTEGQTKLAAKLLSELPTDLPADVRQEISTQNVAQALTPDVVKTKIAEKRVEFANAVDHISAMTNSSFQSLQQLVLDRQMSEEAFKSTRKKRNFLKKRQFKMDQFILAAVNETNHNRASKVIDLMISTGIQSTMNDFLTRGGNAGYRQANLNFSGYAGEAKRGKQATTDGTTGKEINRGGAGLLALEKAASLSVRTLEDKLKEVTDKLQTLHAAGETTGIAELEAQQKEYTKDLKIAQNDHAQFQALIVSLNQVQEDVFSLDEFRQAIGADDKEKLKTDSFLYTVNSQGTVFLKDDGIKTSVNGQHSLYSMTDRQLKDKLKAENPWLGKDEDKLNNAVAFLRSKADSVDNGMVKFRAAAELAIGQLATMVERQAEYAQELQGKSEALKVKREKLAQLDEVQGDKQEREMLLNDIKGLESEMRVSTVRLADLSANLGAMVGIMDPILRGFNMSNAFEMMGLQGNVRMQAKDYAEVVVLPAGVSDTPTNRFIHGMALKETLVDSGIINEAGVLLGDASARQVAFADLAVQGKVDILQRQALLERFDGSYAQKRQAELVAQFQLFSGASMVLRQAVESLTTVQQGVAEMAVSTAPGTTKKQLEDASKALVTTMGAMDTLAELAPQVAESMWESMYSGEVSHGITEAMARAKVAGVLGGAASAFSGLFMDDETSAKVTAGATAVGSRLSDRGGIGPWWLQIGTGGRTWLDDKELDQARRERDYGLDSGSAAVNFMDSMLSIGRLHSDRFQPLNEATRLQQLPFGANFLWKHMAHLAASATMHAKSSDRVAFENDVAMIGKEVVKLTNTFERMIQRGRVEEAAMLYLNLMRAQPVAFPNETHAALVGELGSSILQALASKSLSYHAEDKTTTDSFTLFSRAVLSQSRGLSTDTERTLVSEIFTRAMGNLDRVKDRESYSAASTDSMALFRETQFNKDSIISIFYSGIGTQGARDLGLKPSNYGALFGQLDTYDATEVEDALARRTRERMMATGLMGEIINGMNSAQFTKFMRGFSGDEQKALVMALRVEAEGQGLSDQRVSLQAVAGLSVDPEVKAILMKAAEQAQGEWAQPGEERLLAVQAMQDQRMNAQFALQRILGHSMVPQDKQALTDAVVAVEGTLGLVALPLGGSGLVATLQDTVSQGLQTPYKGIEAETTAPVGHLSLDGSSKSFYSTLQQLRSGRYSDENGMLHRDAFVELSESIKDVAGTINGLVAERDVSSVMDFIGTLVKGVSSENQDVAFRFLRLLGRTVAESRSADLVRTVLEGNVVEGGRFEVLNQQAPKGGAAPLDQQAFQVFNAALVQQGAETQLRLGVTDPQDKIDHEDEIVDTAAKRRQLEVQYLALKQLLPHGKLDAGSLGSQGLESLLTDPTGRAALAEFLIQYKLFTGSDKARDLVLGLFKTYEADQLGLEDPAVAQQQGTTIKNAFADALELRIKARGDGALKLHETVLAPTRKKLGLTERVLPSAIVLKATTSPAAARDHVLSASTPAAHRQLLANRYMADWASKSPQTAVAFASELRAAGGASVLLATNAYRSLQRSLGGVGLNPAQLTALDGELTTTLTALEVQALPANVAERDAELDFRAAIKDLQKEVAFLRSEPLQTVDRAFSSQDLAQAGFVIPDSSGAATDADKLEFFEQYETWISKGRVEDPNDPMVPALKRRLDQFDADISDIVPDGMNKEAFVKVWLTMATGSFESKTSLEAVLQPQTPQEQGAINFLFSSVVAAKQFGSGAKEMIFVREMAKKNGELDRDDLGFFEGLTEANQHAVLAVAALSLDPVGLETMMRGVSGTPAEMDVLGHIDHELRGQPAYEGYIQDLSAQLDSKGVFASQASVQDKRRFALQFLQAVEAVDLGPELLEGGRVISASERAQLEMDLALHMPEVDLALHKPGMSLDRLVGVLFDIHQVAERPKLTGSAVVLGQIKTETSRFASAPPVMAVPSGELKNRVFGLREYLQVTPPVALGDAKAISSMLTSLVQKVTDQDRGIFGGYDVLSKEVNHKSLQDLSQKGVESLDTPTWILSHDELGRMISGHQADFEVLVGPAKFKELVMPSESFAGLGAPDVSHSEAMWREIQLFDLAAKSAASGGRHLDARVLTQTSLQLQAALFRELITGRAEDMMPDSQRAFLAKIADSKVSEAPILDPTPNPELFLKQSPLDQARLFLAHPLVKKRLLEKMGGVTGGDRLIERIEGLRPDAVVSDLSVGRDDVEAGVEMQKVLRALGEDEFDTQTIAARLATFPPTERVAILKALAKERPGYGVAYVHQIIAQMTDEPHGGWAVFWEEIKAQDTALFASEGQPKLVPDTSEGCERAYRAMGVVDVGLGFVDGSLLTISPTLLQKKETFITAFMGVVDLSGLRGAGRAPAVDTDVYYARLSDALTLPGRFSSELSTFLTALENPQNSESVRVLQEVARVVDTQGLAPDVVAVVNALSDPRSLASKVHLDRLSQALRNSDQTLLAPLGQAIWQGVGLRDLTVSLTLSVPTQGVEASQDKLNSIIALLKKDPASLDDVEIANLQMLGKELTDRLTDAQKQALEKAFNPTMIIKGETVVLTGAKVTFDDLIQSLGNPDSLRSTFVLSRLAEWLTPRYAQDSLGISLAEAPLRSDHDGLKAFMVKMADLDQDHLEAALNPMHEPDATGKMIPFFESGYVSYEDFMAALADPAAPDSANVLTRLEDIKAKYQIGLAAKETFVEVLLTGIQTIPDAVRFSRTLSGAFLPLSKPEVVLRDVAVALQSPDHRADILNLVSDPVYGSKFVTDVMDAIAAVKDKLECQAMIHHVVDALTLDLSRTQAVDVRSGSLNHRRDVRGAIQYEESFLAQQHPYVVYKTALLHPEVIVALPNTPASDLMLESILAASLKVSGKFDQISAQLLAHPRMQDIIAQRLYDGHVDTTEFKNAKLALEMMARHPELLSDILGQALVKAAGLLDGPEGFIGFLQEQDFLRFTFATSQRGVILRDAIGVAEKSLGVALPNLRAELEATYTVSPRLAAQPIDGAAPQSELSPEFVPLSRGLKNKHLSGGLGRFETYFQDYEGLASRAKTTADVDAVLQLRSQIYPALLEVIPNTLDQRALDTFFYRFEKYGSLLTQSQKINLMTALVKGKALDRATTTRIVNAVLGDKALHGTGPGMFSSDPQSQWLLLRGMITDHKSARYVFDAVFTKNTDVKHVKDMDIPPASAQYKDHQLSRTFNGERGAVQGGLTQDEFRRGLLFTMVDHIITEHTPKPPSKLHNRLYSILRSDIGMCGELCELEWAGTYLDNDQAFDYSQALKPKYGDPSELSRYVWICLADAEIDDKYIKAFRENNWYARNVEGRNNLRQARDNFMRFTYTMIEMQIEMGRPVEPFFKMLRDVDPIFENSTVDAFRDIMPGSHQDNEIDGVVFNAKGDIDLGKSTGATADLLKTLQAEGLIEIRFNQVLTTDKFDPTGRIMRNPDGTLKGGFKALAAKYGRMAQFGVKGSFEMLEEKLTQRLESMLPAAALAGTTLEALQDHLVAKGLLMKDGDMSRPLTTRSEVAAGRKRATAAYYPTEFFNPSDPLPLDDFAPFKLMTSDQRAIVEAQVRHAFLYRPEMDRTMYGIIRWIPQVMYGNMKDPAQAFVKKTEVAKRSQVFRRAYEGGNAVERGMRAWVMRAEEKAFRLPLDQAFPAPNNLRDIVTMSQPEYLVKLLEQSDFRAQRELVMAMHDIEKEVMKPTIMGIGGHSETQVRAVLNLFFDRIQKLKDGEAMPAAIAQSLYSFMNADPVLFKDVYRKYADVTPSGAQNPKGQKLHQAFVALGWSPESFMHKGESSVEKDIVAILRQHGAKISAEEVPLILNLMVEKGYSFASLVTAMRALDHTFQLTAGTGGLPLTMQFMHKLKRYALQPDIQKRIPGTDRPDVSGVIMDYIRAAHHKAVAAGDRPQSMESVDLAFRYLSTESKESRNRNTEFRPVPKSEVVRMRRALLHLRTEGAGVVAASVAPTTPSDDDDGAFSTTTADDASSIGSGSLRRRDSVFTVSTDPDLDPDDVSSVSAGLSRRDSVAGISTVSTDPSVVDFDPSPTDHDVRTLTRPPRLPDQLPPMRRPSPDVKIAGVGYDVDVVPGNGACFFEAVVRELNQLHDGGEPWTAASYRGAVVDGMAGDPAVKEGYNKVRLDGDPTFEDYIASMRVPTTYADAHVVSYVTRILEGDGIDLRVATTDFVKAPVFNQLENAALPHKICLLLEQLRPDAADGVVGYDGGHYNRLIKRAEGPSTLSRPAPVAAPVVDVEPSVVAAAAPSVNYLKQSQEAVSAFSIRFGTTAAAKAQPNQNRYRDILPFDGTRVVLAGGGAIGNDYINANTVAIKVGDVERRYIASQGPTDDTVPHFWQMVWEQDSPEIVMLTGLKEKDAKGVEHSKCAKYWPDAGNTQAMSDGLRATTLSETESKAMTVRFIQLEKGGVVRCVPQFHFTAWPDHGVPTPADQKVFRDKKAAVEQVIATRGGSGDDDIETLTSAGFLLAEANDIVRHIRENAGQFPASDKPPVIHCSAGVGRTGTYIALDTKAALKEAGEVCDLDTIDAIFHQMRNARSTMVQTAEQFEMLLEPSDPFDPFDKGIALPGGQTVGAHYEALKKDLLSNRKVEVLDSANEVLVLLKDKKLLTKEDRQLFATRLVAILEQEHRPSVMIEKLSEIRDELRLKPDPPTSLPSLGRTIARKPSVKE